MSPIEHYFENLLMFGHDVDGEPNKSKLTLEVQEAIETCAEYIRYDKLLESAVLKDIKAEIREAMNEPLYQHEDEDWCVGLEMALDIIDEHCGKENVNEPN